MSDNFKSPRERLAVAATIEEYLSLLSEEQIIAVIANPSRFSEISATYGGTNADLAASIYRAIAQTALTALPESAPQAGEVDMRKVVEVLQRRFMRALSDAAYVSRFEVESCFKLAMDAALTAAQPTPSPETKNDKRNQDSGKVE